MKLLIAGAILVFALVLTAILYIWYIWRMSILDKRGMVFEEPSSKEENKA